MLVPVNNQRNSQADDDQHLVDLWLHGKSPHSQEAYQRDINQFVDFVDLPLTNVKLQHLWEWADHLQTADIRPATQARKLAAVKSLFSFAHRIGYMKFNVGAAVRLPTIPEKLSERILTVEEIDLILAQSNTLRNRVLLKLFYSSGARVSELSGLYWGAVASRNHNRQGQITLIGKGNKSRTLILPAPVWRELNELRSEMEATQPTQPVFLSKKGGALTRQQIWRIVQNSAKAAGLSKNVSPHWLRHAHASHALDNGAPVHLVKDSLGHQSLATTSKYAHARPDESSSSYIKV